MTDDSSLWLIITLTAIGFFALAAILLIPVYRFLLREEEFGRRLSAGLVTLIGVLLILLR